MEMPAEPGLGATYLGHGRTRFLVWAPRASSVELRLTGTHGAVLPMTAAPHGYFVTVAEGVHPGARYLYRLDGDKERPDPASHSQPEGVHGPSQVVDPEFAWQSGAWPGVQLENYIFYEVHTGAFTAQGTFDGAIARLDSLAGLGVTAVELMPVAQFPGSRNWGYDGVYPFAVQNSYGGPHGLKRFVDACHGRGLAVVLDVVYNHLGPEGNYFNDFAPYFTDRYQTPWGDALNFDGPYSDEVRRFFIENALRWVTEFRIDALRLDATHAIFDSSALPFLRELCQAVHSRAAQLRRRIHVIAESDANDVRTVLPPEVNGHGFDAQWADGFHHALHAVLTGERDGYYEDYGDLRQLAKAFRSAYVYTGEYSRHRKRRHGSPTAGLPGHCFVVFSQNHDQTGNRMLGDRLAALVGFEQLKLAAGAVLLSPYLPLLFMGEEYGETAPFQYFVSHSDAALVEAVRRGRREEFAAFAWRGECPDPQSESTFLACRLREPSLAGRSCVLLAFYKELIRLRKKFGTLSVAGPDDVETGEVPGASALWVYRRQGASRALIAFNFGTSPASVECSLPAGDWYAVIDSSDIRWEGPGGGPPEMLHSAGSVSLALPASSFAAYYRSLTVAAQYERTYLHNVTEPRA